MASELDNQVVVVTLVVVVGQVLLVAGAVAAFTRMAELAEQKVLRFQA
jgi:hypothetical protein